MIDRHKVRTAAKRRLLARIAVVTALGTSFASAQEAPNSSSTEATPQLSAVIVTAQRRAQTVQDVPFTVDVATGAQLQQAGVTNLQSLAAVTSNVVMGNGGDNVQPAIRGISSYGTGPGEAPNVAIYLDGVYEPIQKADFFDLPDISRVEILKGPQGTLFGANATGGAIRIFTEEPTENPTGKVEVGYGNYDSTRDNLFIGGPLVSGVLLGSLTGSYQHQEGYSKNLLSGEQFGTYKSQLLRSKLKYVGSDWFQAELIGLWFDRKDPNAYAGSVLDGNTLGAAVDPAAIFGRKPWQTAQNVGSFGDSEGHQVSLLTTATLPGVRVQNQVAYQMSDNDILSDIDYSSAPLVVVGLHEKNRTVTDDLEASSEGNGPFHWIVGYFYLYNKTDDHEELNQNPVLAGDNIFVRERARDNDFFVNFTYDFTDRLQGIIGARYSNEWTEAFAAVGTPDTPRLGAKSWTVPTPRASLRYRLTPSTNVYATFSQGFKSGVFGGFDFSKTPVNPERVNAYEVGVKSVIARIAEVNAAAYYYDYKDEQFSQYNGLYFVYQNAASSHIYGLETDGLYHILPGLDARLSAAYNHANYVSFPGASAEIPTGLGGNVSVSENLSGKPMARAPRWSGSIGLSYKLQVAHTVTTASVNAAVSSTYYFEPSYRIVQPSYVKLNAQIDFRPSKDSGFTFRLWGNNLSNVAVIEAPIIISLGDFINYAPPRTFGGSVIYQF